MPDKNHPLPAVIWVIVPGDLEQLWAQSGRPDKIALLAHNSTIFSVLLLSVWENVGQMKAVDIPVKGRFRLEPDLPRLPSYWPNIRRTPIPRERLENKIMFPLCPFAVICLLVGSKHRHLSSKTSVLPRIFFMDSTPWSFGVNFRQHKSITIAAKMSMANYLLLPYCGSQGPS